MFPVKQKTMRGAFIRASKVAAGDCNARFGKQWQVAKASLFHCKMLLFLLGCKLKSNLDALNVTVFIIGVNIIFALI